MRVLVFISFFLLLLVPAVQAQEAESDGGFLTRTIEGALSGAGREVKLVGFAGALSSEATFERMTIADTQGIWLTLEDVALNWRRVALLRGRLEVNSLTARSLILARLPEAEEEPFEVPAAEAQEFSLQLPELPVSINIGAFEVSSIELGEPLLGIPARLSLKASARLDDDGLVLDLAADRIDEVTGRFGLRANVQRDGGLIDLDLTLDEAREGLAARLLNLPGLPSVDLSVSGQGPLDDFAADIRLATDTQPRLSGQVMLKAERPEGQEGSPNRRILADLGGDITALVAPEYQSFFGTDVGLNVDTLLVADGSVDVSRFALSARAVELAGRVQLNSDRWPTLIDVTGRVSQEGTSVVLPGSDGGVSVRAIDLAVAFDAAQANALTGRFDIRGLIHEAARFEQVVLTLDGELDAAVDSIGRFAADIAVDARGVDLTDQSASQALGDRLRAAARVTYSDEAPVEITGLTLNGPDFGMRGDLVIAGLGNGFPTDLTLDVTATDLSRFAGLAGRSIAGAAELSVSGRVVPLSSIFDLRIEGVARDIVLDIAQADPLLRGRTELSVGAERGVSGTFLRGLTVQNDAFDVAADVTLRTNESDVKARVALNDIALVLPDYKGAVLLDAEARQTKEGWWQVDTSLDAPYEAKALIRGLATGPQADLRFEISMPDVQPVVASAQGRLDARGRLWQAPDGYMIDVSASGPFDAELDVDGLATGPNADLRFSVSVPDVQPILPSAQGPLDARGRLWQAPEGYMVDVSAGGPFGADLDIEGLATGPNARVNLVANLPDMGVLIPELAGALALQGEVAREGAQDWAVDTLLEGPAGMRADIAGTVAGDASMVDLAIAGQLPLGLAGPFLAPRSITGPAVFDLFLKGAPSLDALSGRITTSDARFSAPNLRATLEGITSRIDLAQSVAQLDVGARIAAGGDVKVTGAINLASLAADLSIALRRAVLIDPNLYSATLDADVTVNGPLAGGARIGGRIDLAEVNVSVPGTGVTSIGSIPEIKHVGAAAGVTDTRARAGVLPKETASGAASTAPAYPLSIDINAPSKIFVRGRGINAEMGGDLQVRGDTNTVVSAGSFDLIRGRIDIIGKRFELDEGSVQFQGTLTPYILFVTTTQVPDGTASITVEGIATEPEITFSAVPEVPEDEVLSLILFGRYISELSAFQALQLANGVSQLTGKGGVNVIGNLRDGIGLDELDVTTDEAGSTSVTAGKYITDRIYTDVTTNSEKGTDISLNIDLTNDLTGKATVAEDGDSSIGLFFERDY